MPLSDTTGITPRRHLLHTDGPLSETLPASKGPMGLTQPVLWSIKPHTSKMLLLNTHFRTHTLSRKCQKGLPHRGILG